MGERARGSRDRRPDGGGAPQDAMVEETEDGKGRAAIPAACWQLYRVTLRRLSIRQPFESLATILSGFLVRPPSAPLSAPLSLAILYRTNDNVFGIYRQQPLMSRYSYVSAVTNARFAIVRVKNRMDGSRENLFSASIVREVSLWK